MIKKYGDERHRKAFAGHQPRLVAGHLRVVTDLIRWGVRSGDDRWFSCIDQRKNLRASVRSWISSRERRFSAQLLILDDFRTRTLSDQQRFHFFEIVEEGYR